MVNGLVAAGYVTRTRQPGDKRSVLVTLTDAGREKHRQRQQQLTETLQQVFADYEAAALDSAAVVLDRLAAIYDEL